MLGGGYYRGSSILVSGTAGTGKSSLSAHIADATCRRGERCLYFAFEESGAQIIRNMRSIGIDLQQWLDKGLLRFHAARPSLHGLEMHLSVMHKLVETFDPALVIVDPISNFSSASSDTEAHAMLLRLVDYLKTKGKTAFLISLTGGGQAWETTDVGISSIVDTWLLLRDIELGGERNRGLYILKSRGMAHSNQIREFLLTNNGIELRDAYIGTEGVLTGSMRVAQEARERAAAAARDQEAAKQRRIAEQKRKALEAQIASLQAELAGADAELDLAHERQAQHQEQLLAERASMARSRKADANGGGDPVSGGEVRR